MPNKYHYDVKNCKYFKGTRAADGSITFEGAAVDLPGLMSFESSIEGDVQKIRADGIDYLVIAAPTGASLTLNFVMIPDQLKLDCLCEVEDDATGIRYLDTSKEPAPFALVGEFKGDAENIRWIYYNCVGSVPGISGDNKENVKNPDTESLTVKASSLPITIGTQTVDVLRGGVTKTQNEATYNAWFTKVCKPGDQTQNQTQNP